MPDSRGTLAPLEPHPASFSALKWLRTLPLAELYQWQESFSSCAIEGNRLGEICSETLRRFMNGEPVSDRYIVCLAWTIRDMKEKSDDK